MDVMDRRDSAYAKVIWLGKAARGRHPTGAEAIVDAYLGDQSLHDFIETRMGDLDQLEVERRLYNPALWRSVTEELRAEMDGVYYGSRAKDRFAIREAWARARDMAVWHLRPIWGGPGADRLWQLGFVHRSYFGDCAPIVVADEWKRKIKPAAKAALLAANDFQCVRCGSSRRLSVDHVVPIMRGGLNYGLNFQTLCMPCNQWKSTRVWWPGVPDGVEARFPRRDLANSARIREARA